jgi:hypothetical protein
LLKLLLLFLLEAAFKATMGSATKLTPGLCYSLNSMGSSLKLSVQAQGCPNSTDAIRFRLLPAGKYLRINEAGHADMKGGGGGYCHFVPEQTDCGLLKFSRGPYRLSTVDGHVASVIVSEASTLETTLWEVEENQMPEGPPVSLVFLCCGSFEFGPFQREDVKEDVVRLQAANQGYLRIVPGNGQVDASGGGGLPCQFKISMTGDGIFTLRSEGENARLLGVNSWGALSGRHVAADKQLFCWKTLESPLGSPIPLASLVGTSDFDETIDLTPEQRKSFVEDGFLIIRGAVPPCLATAALAVINRSLLKHGTSTIEENGNLRYCTDICGNDTILALLYGTPLWTIAQRLMGRGSISRKQAAQIALRPPSDEGADLESNTKMLDKRWHFDGMLPEKSWTSFALLVGIALSDQSLPNSGNLIAFKGSHQILQPMVREESQAPGSHAFLSGTAKQDAQPELRNGEQMLLNVGDAVLLHQKTAHRGGLNGSPNIRYQAYFRLHHVEHAAHVADGSIHDGLWRQFGGLQGHDAMLTEPSAKRLNTGA